MGIGTEALALEESAAGNVEAAVSELSRDNSPFSIELLLAASDKERRSLDAIEDVLEALRASLAQRRSAIDQQEEMLRDLAQSLVHTNGKRR
jgi:hypothetical protein